MSSSIPRFSDLAVPEGESLPLVRSVWGANDQLGMLNNIGEQTVAAASALIRQGARFNLNLPLHMPLGMLGEGAHRQRCALRHSLFKTSGKYLLVCDDKVDDFYMQGSTQWDGLTHIGDPAHGFYNGVMAEQITQVEGTRNGIEHYSNFGIAGRAVLIDLPRYYARHGREWSSVGSMEASADDLRECLNEQGDVLERGDILLIRTGWVTDFRAAADIEERERLFRTRDYSGLSGDAGMWAFLWDSRVAAVAADSPTVEAFPLDGARPSLHLAIARLGLILGEMFDLDALADAAAADGRHASFFTSSPLNLIGGVGSPANAMAIR